MRKKIIFDGETFRFVTPFGSGAYYESETRFILTGKLGNIELCAPKKETRLLQDELLSQH